VSIRDHRTSMQLGTDATHLQHLTIDTPGANLKRKLLDIDDLVEAYGFKRWTIRTYCSQRKIPHIKIGRRVFFDPVSIEAWIQEHTRPVRDVQIP
jgi:predicted DNA-binding transcriptional regulator AlpA